MAFQQRTAEADRSPPASPIWRDRNRFIAALVLFAVWITALVAMVVFSASRPQSHRNPTRRPGPSGPTADERTP